MYYVSMIDSFMSGWGMAKNKRNRLIFECPTMKDVKAIQAYAKTREEMLFIMYHGNTMPEFSTDTNYIQIKNKELYPIWYSKGYELIADYEYVVMMGFPGCLPEDEPQIFETLKEAKQYLSDIKQQWAMGYDKLDVVVPLKEITKTELIEAYPYSIVYIESRSYQASIAVKPKEDNKHE